MPEMTFDVRWPDGEVTRCWSPSLVVHDYLTVGAGYRVADFLQRTTRAMTEADRRVREKYGFGCAGARATADGIVAAAARFDPGADVRVLAMEPGPP